MLDHNHHQKDMISEVIDCPPSGGRLRGHEKKQNNVHICLQQSGNYFQEFQGTSRHIFDGTVMRCKTLWLLEVCLVGEQDHLHEIGQMENNSRRTAANSSSFRGCACV